MMQPHAMTLQGGVDFIYLDLKRAFDRAPTDDFVMEAATCCSGDRKTSTNSGVRTSRVNQGSVQAPVKLIVYIVDLAEEIQN